MHPWIDTMMYLIAGGDWKRAADMLPIFKPLLRLATPRWAKDAYKMHVDLMRSKALGRLDYKGERLDFMTRMAAPDSGLTPDQFIASADTVLLRGSETTSTLLSGCTYLLLKNPAALKKLVNEIRAAFKSEEDITLSSVNSLDYMLACLDEAFRLYPPVAGSLPRRTVVNDVIAGKLVPAGVSSQACPPHELRTLTQCRHACRSTNGPSIGNRNISGKPKNTFPGAGLAILDSPRTTGLRCNPSVSVRGIA